MFGYTGSIRDDRDDRPTGILRESFSLYPVAQFAAEQKRFARGLRDISQRLESPPSRTRLHFFGFDIDALPGGGYEELAEILNTLPPCAAVDRIRSALTRVPGETIENEIARLDQVIKLIDGDSTLAGLRHSATCLRDSFEYVRITYPAKTFDALNPGMAFRERFMHRQIDYALAQMQDGEKLALMSHNMHLCRAPEAVARSDAGAGPGGKTNPPLGASLASRFPGEAFSVWMLIGRGTDLQPFPSLSSNIREKSGTLNALLGEIADCFLLPIDAADPRARILTENIEIMHDANGGVRTAIARQADAIFFIGDVTPLHS
jgi:erythromycin esterase-like protein